MRTYQEIQSDARKALARNDAEALKRCAGEMDQHDTPIAMAAAYRCRGLASYMHGEYSSALEQLQRAMEQFQALSDLVTVADLRGNIGTILYSTGKYPEALEYLHHALAEHESLGNRSGIGSAALNIGSVHSDTGNYPLAMECFNRALSIFDELSDRSAKAATLNNIGNLQGAIDEFTKALVYFKEALALYEDLGNRGGAALALHNLGAGHISLGMYADGLKYLNRSLAMFMDIGDRHGTASTMVSLSGICLLMNNNEDALKHLATLDAMDIVEPAFLFRRELNRAELQARREDHKSAVISLELALEIASAHQLRRLQAEAHQCLRDLAHKQNDLNKYVQHNVEFTRIKEEINGKDTATKLAMQAKQAEIDAREREHQKHLAVLHSTLPKSIADRVAQGELVNDHYESAVVIFLDIVGFTNISEQLTSTEVVQLLDTVFTALDAVCKKHDVVKIKTIGDSYMAVAFPSAVPHSVRNDSASTSFVSEEREVVHRAANAALEMMHAVSHIVSPTGSPIQVRLGVHCGAVTAGVIGTERMQYDVWGDTVNVASRMESTGEPGRIHVSSSFALALNGEMAKERKGETDVIPSDSEEGATDVIPSDSGERGTSSLFPVPCSLRERGALEIKGKGLITTYWLEG